LEDIKVSKLICQKFVYTDMIEGSIYSIYTLNASELLISWFTNFNSSLFKSYHNSFQQHLELHFDQYFKIRSFFFECFFLKSFFFSNLLLFIY